MSQLENHKTMRTITLEEHYATPAFMEGPGRQLKEQAQAAHAHPQVVAGIAQLLDRLCDLDDHRIADMDAAGIDMQVLSLTSPGVEQLDATEAVALAHEPNHHPADSARRHPRPFAGLPALPPPAPAPAPHHPARTHPAYGCPRAPIHRHSRRRSLH